MSVEGGNWKIFHEMITASGAKLNLNTPVTKIEKVTHGSKSAWKLVSDHESGYFDSVVLASPMVPLLRWLI
jgi:prenylcysteine oxidase/farnesylcysteine lyase